MPSRLTSRRRLLTVVLAALVTYAPLNCLVSAVWGCEQMEAPLAVSSWPHFVPGLFGGCENESGCICRGATLVVPEDGRSLAPVATDWLPAETADSTLASLVEAAAFQPHAAYFAPPPLSGRILRAHLASLLI
jgi:hypothetical protein